MITADWTNFWTGALAFVLLLAAMLWSTHKFEKQISAGLDAWAAKLKDRSELERDRWKIYNDGWQRGRAEEREIWKNRTRKK